MSKRYLNVMPVGVQIDVEFNPLKKNKSVVDADGKVAQIRLIIAILGNIRATYPNGDICEDDAVYDWTSSERDYFLANYKEHYV